MPDAPADVALRVSLASLAARSDVLGASDQVGLRERVFAAVDELKSMGWPIERVVVRLKEVALEAGFRPARTPSPPSSQPHDREAVVSDVVRWCIERYYGSGSPPERSV